MAIMGEANERRFAMPRAWGYNKDFVVMWIGTFRLWEVWAQKFQWLETSRREDLFLETYYDVFLRTSYEAHPNRSIEHVRYAHTNSASNASMADRKGWRIVL
jgi:hypothetical protein